MRFDTARIEREDLVMFVNACFAGSAQEEFHAHGAGREAVSLAFLHDYILGNYRRLYARTLAAGINDHNRALIAANLLAAGAPRDAASRAEEGALVAETLRAMPPPRVYKVFAALRARRVNNRRARAVVREWLAARPDLALDVLKYRDPLRAAATHAHAPLPGEVGVFLFAGGARRDAWRSPLLDAWRRAQTDREALYELPYTIAEGFAARHGVDRAEFLRRIEPRLTALERLRLQTASERSGEAPVALDLARAPLTRLALYALSLPVDARAARRAELDAALRASAGRALRRAPMRLGRVVAVLDRSHSAGASGERRNRPHAVALGASYLLQAAASEYRALWTPATGDPLLAAARGQTDLARPLLDALATRPDLVVVVSDGYENDPPGGAAEVARVYRTRLDPERRTSIVHLNPVFDAERFAPRALGPLVPVVGLRDAEDLLTVLNFARFAEGTATLEALEEHLAACVRRVLGRAARRGHDARAAAPASDEAEEAAP